MHNGKQAHRLLLTLSSLVLVAASGQALSLASLMKARTLVDALVGIRSGDPVALQNHEPGIGNGSLALPHLLDSCNWPRSAIISRAGAWRMPSFAGSDNRGKQTFCRDFRRRLIIKHVLIGHLVRSGRPKPLALRRKSRSRKPPRVRHRRWHMDDRKRARASRIIRSKLAIAPPGLAPTMCPCPPYQGHAPRGTTRQLLETRKNPRRPNPGRSDRPRRAECTV